MAVRYAVFFLVASLVMGALHRYVWTRLIRDAHLPPRWTRFGTVLFVALYITLFASFFAARFLSRAAAAPIVWVGYTWLGLLFFLAFACAVTEAARWIALRLARSRSRRVEGAEDADGPADVERRQAIGRIFGAVAALLGVGMSGAGMVSALSSVAIARVRVGIQGWKKRDGYRIVQISDVHVGPTIGRGFVEEIVAKINALEPDLVAITGDLVDGSVDDLAAHVAPLANIAAKDGVFFVTGNHEYYSGAAAWCAHLTSLGIRVLRNEHVRIGGDDGFDVAGIDDASSRGLVPGHGPDVHKALAQRDPSRPVVLLAHQPKGVETADELGVDLQLSGHTHGGQLFPWNFLVRLQQPFVAGLHRVRKTQIYVSRGTGYWGPPMRLGAPAEITEILLSRA